MEQIDCGACCAKTPARPPNKAFWGWIAAFWMASVIFGFFAAKGDGWDVVLLASWAALATSVVLFARRATTWTCAECGSTVVPPAAVTAPPLTGSFRATHARHA
ncbi:MAG: hypothetical protein NVS3B10_13810 [Polyangiales bacterium]